MRQSPTHRLAHTPHLGTLRVSGEDRLVFLQGQATCDFRRQSSAAAWPGALCNAKGRVLANFLALQTDEAFTLILSRDLLDAVRAHLVRFILRARVRVDTTPDTLLGLYPPVTAPLIWPEAVLAVTAAPPCTLIRLWGEIPRALLICPPANAPDIPASHSPENATDTWRREDLLAGWPWVTRATTERFTPHMLGLDAHGAISFDKGCYTGQEVIARTHYLGTVRRGTRQIHGDGTPPRTGDALDDGSVVLDACAQGTGWLALVVTANTGSA